MNCFPALRLACQFSGIKEVLSAAGLTSWAAIESMPTNMPFGMGMQWTLPEDAAYSLDPRTIITITKMELLLTSPKLFEAKEVLSYLPQPGASPWLTDIGGSMFGLGESLGILFAKAALGFGERKQL